MTATCAMYNCHTKGSFPRERCNGKANTIEMAILPLSSQDPDIIHDLRELDARPKNKIFDVFREKNKSLREFYARVDDRRHGKM